MSWWDQTPEVPEFIGLPLEEALELCHQRGYEGPRVLVVPIEGSIIWTMDGRSNRLNVVVREGRVERAGLF